MRNINVLHFSDLHLKYDNDVEFSSFLDDISDCISEINKPIHIITITGDLIDKGKVNDFSKFYEKFIKPISKVTNCPESHIFCVPGNHDAERDNNIINLRKQFDDNNASGMCFQIARNEFRKTLSRFEDFEEINKKLHPDDSNTKSYGIDLVNINGINVVFVRINSAIYSHDNADYQKLGLSKAQLDDLARQYKRIIDKSSVDLTIALMHHPDDWLRDDERKHLWEYFTSHNKLPIDMIFHGHTHEGKIGGKIDLDSFILSLVTGTTYESGDKERSPFGLCRFALYQIDVDEKMIQGNLYIANNKGKFVADTSNYNSVNQDGTFCIPYDQIVFKSKGSVKLPLPIENHVIADTDYINIFDGMVKKMWDFEKSCRLHLDAFSSVPKSEFEKDETTILKDWFISIASSARNCLFEKNEIENVRAHFRVYQDGKHIHFCATIGDRQITPITWSHSDNLIFHAFDQKRSLVKSLNPNLFFNTNGEWVDFLTVPIFDKYNGNEIPKYSFGISIKGCQNEMLTKKLEILSFLRIESLIDSICASFRRRYLT